MDGPGDELLARAGLAGDQHGGIGRRDLGHVGEHRPEGRGGADDLLEHRRLVDLLTEDDVLSLQLVLQPLDLGVGLLESLARFLGGGDVHHGADVLGAAGRGVVEGMRHDVQMLHGAVGHQESMLEIPVLGLARGAIDELLHAVPVLGMGS